MMPVSDKNPARPRKALGSILAFLLLAVIMIAPLHNVNAVQMVSGATPPVGNSFPRGDTSYTVYYSYPAVAQVGTTLTISLTLHINSLTGILLHVTGYDLEAELFIGNNVLNGTVISPNGSPFLFAGASWGPSNVTIPLTEQNTGLTKGQSANATVAIVINDQILYGPPINSYEPEPALQTQAGSILIQDAVPTSTSTNQGGGGGNQTILPYALLGSGAVLMIAAILLPRGPKPPA